MPRCRPTSAATQPIRRTLRSRSALLKPSPAESSRRTTSPSSRVIVRSPVSRSASASPRAMVDLPEPEKPVKKTHQAAVPARRAGPDQLLGDRRRGVPLGQREAAVEQVVDLGRGHRQAAVARRDVVAPAPLAVPVVVGQLARDQHPQAAAGEHVAGGEHVGHAVRRGDPGPQQRVAHLVAARQQRHRDDGGRRHPVAGREDRPDQRLRRQAVRAGAAHRDQDQQVRGEGAGGVRDLRQLRPVQRPVGDHAEHPAGREQRADLLRAYAAGAGTGRARRRPSGAPGRRRRSARSAVGQTSVTSSAATGAPSGSVRMIVRCSGSSRTRPLGQLAGDLQGDRRPATACRRRAGRGGAARPGRPGRGIRSAARRRRRAGVRGPPAHAGAACTTARHAARPRAAPNHSLSYPPAADLGDSFAARADRGRDGCPSVCRRDAFAA